MLRLFFGCILSLVISILPGFTGPLYAVDVSDSHDSGRIPLIETRGFQGWLVITSDRDWKEKWDTPPEVIPKFTEVDQIHLGESITILTLYTNPTVDDSGNIRLSCDIKMVQPDGSISIELGGIVCGDEKLEGAVDNIRLAYAVVDFTAELQDQRGTWSVEVMLRDDNAGTAVFLSKQFEFVDQGLFTSREKIDVMRAAAGISPGVML